MESSDWRQMARDYLGLSASDVLHNTPLAQRPAAFAEAWTRLESCLKFVGLPLTEWNPHLAQQVLNCHVMALALPERCRGSLATSPRKMADPCVALNSELSLKHHFPEENLLVQREGLARMIGEIGPVG